MGKDLGDIVISPYIKHISNWYQVHSSCLSYHCDDTAPAAAALAIASENDDYDHDVIVGSQLAGKITLQCSQNEHFIVQGTTRKKYKRCTKI